jgi:hypothetical protein
MAVKSKVKISQNFVASSEYMNFTFPDSNLILSPKNKQTSVEIETEPVLLLA